MPFELEKKLYDALKAFDALPHRIENCGDPNCKTCSKMPKIHKDVREALREFEEKYGIDDLPF
jgi:hypothetical protein